MGNVRYWVALLFVGLLLATQDGCARSKSSRFYLLSAESQAEGVTRQGDLALGIGPIELPEYLDRPQIVTRSGGNRLELAEFDRWAEPLDKNFSRVLADNLSALLSTDRIVHYPWKRTEGIDYQVVVTVTRLDAVMSDSVSLYARWAVLGADGDVLIPTRTSRIDESMSGSNFDALALAASRATDRLSREIATSVIGVARSP